MKISSIFFPGSYEDAYLYMGRLIALTTDKSIRLFDMENIVDSLEDQYPDSRPLITWQFLRNDWLASRQFRSLLDNRDIALAFLKTLESLSSITPIEISDGTVGLKNELQVDIPAIVVLDMTIYNQRLYLSSDSGLFHIDLDWFYNTYDFSGDFIKRHDIRCMSASAGYGTINSSCGDEGLLSSLNDFGWGDYEKKNAFKKYADKSFRTSWYGYDLINYISSSTPVLLQTEHEKVSGGFYDEYEKSILTSISTQELNLNYLVEGLCKEFDLPLDTIQYVYNSSSTLFIHTLDGRLFTLGVKRSPDQPPKKEYSRKYDDAPKQVISAQSSRAGLIVESEDRVEVFANSEWHPIITSESISVRTFLKSKRYKNIVAITTEDGIFISSLFDETPLTT